jgi:tetratricopeptide (TPR) repeat protein
VSRFRNLELVEVDLSGVTVRETERKHLQEAREAELEGTFEPALRSYSAALRRETTLSEAWCGQVRCLVHLEEYTEAMTWGQKAAAVLPACPLTRSTFAYALARSGLAAEGMEKSDEAFELEEAEADPYLWLERAVCLLGLQRQKSAEACLSKVNELRVDADWQQRQAQEFLFFGQAEPALEILNTVVASRPNRAYTWLLLAQAYRQIGDSKRHARALSRASELRPFWDLVQKEQRLGMPFPLWVRRLYQRLRGKKNG